VINKIILLYKLSLDILSGESMLDDIIKGKIAETIVEDMFKKVGYVVLPFGYEKILSSLTSKHFNIGNYKIIMDILNKTKKNESDERKIQEALPEFVKMRIKSLPDFIVLRKLDKDELELVNKISDGIEMIKKDLDISDNRRFYFDTNLHFVEVKYRSSGYFRYPDWWIHFNLGYELILVTPNPPYFQNWSIIHPNQETDLVGFDYTFTPLKDSEVFTQFNDFNFNPYIRMIKKYFTG
jgi:hypothetical protein